LATQSYFLILVQAGNSQGAKPDKSSLCFW